MLPRVKGLTRPFYRSVLRVMGMTPMRRVMRRLDERGIRLRELAGLEVFGGTGTLETLDYVALIGSLDIWEIDPALENVLKRNLPTARVTIADSYEEVARTSNRYSLIVIDNPMSTYGKRCEHFDLFPAIFRIAKDTAVLMVNVTPEIDGEVRKSYPYMFNEKQLECRRAFYRTDTPEKVSIEHMAVIYEEHAKHSGFKIDLWFAQRRTHMYYLVMLISKVQQTHAQRS